MNLSDAKSDASRHWMLLTYFSFENDHHLSAGVNTRTSDVCCQSFLSFRHNIYIQHIRSANIRCKNCGVNLQPWIWDSWLLYTTTPWRPSSQHHHCPRLLSFWGMNFQREVDTLPSGLPACVHTCLYVCVLENTMNVLKFILDHRCFHWTLTWVISFHTVSSLW